MMKLSDFSKDQIVINVYDALDTLYHDGPIEDAYPYFFDRLRYALHYFDLCGHLVPDVIPRSS